MRFTREDVNLWALRLARKTLSEELTGKVAKFDTFGTNILIYFTNKKYVFMVGPEPLAKFISENKAET